MVKAYDKPIKGALVIGRTAATEYSQLIQTDELGRATLQWIGHSALAQISVNYVAFEGLWRSGEIATIDITPPGVGSKTSFSSNGQHAQEVTYTEVES